MTAGSYPDDGLGEVFLKLGKQGSTLAGMMDAFSIAISIALQYGVPLETYVEKFTNMRFEPAGHDRRPGRPDGARRSWTTSSVGWRWTTCPSTNGPRSASTPLPSGHGSSTPARTPRSRTMSTWRRCRSRRRSETGDGAPGRRRSGPDATAPSRSSSRRQGRAGSGAHVDRADRGDAGHVRRRAAVLHLRHEDAPGRQLLRLRGLRLHQRLQLIALGHS